MTTLTQFLNQQAAAQTGVGPMTVGIQPQPAPGAEFIGKDASHYFEEAGHRDYFINARKLKKNHNKANRPGPAWTEADEVDLVNRLHMDWFDSPWSGNSWEYNALDLDALENKPLRKKELSAFKINYETYPEIKLRLLNTVISIKGHPFVVARIRQTLDSKFHLCVQRQGEQYTVPYDELRDLRSIPPLYVQGQNGYGAGWLCRNPVRIYQQGLNRHNTMIKTVDGESGMANLDIHHFVNTFPKRTLRRWDGTLLSLMECGDLPVTRLSDEVAVKAKKGSIVACYKGRALGKVQGNDVSVFDEDDLLQGWIEKSVQEVGLELRAER